MACAIICAEMVDFNSDSTAKSESTAKGTDPDWYMVSELTQVFTAAYVFVHIPSKKERVRSVKLEG